MLEKFFDAHLHLNAENLNSENKSASNFYSGCISLHEDDNPVLKQGYVFSYGVHPLNPDKKFLYKLEELLSNQNKNPYKILAVGECGLDFYNRENCTEEKRSLQMEVFDAQIELAVKYGKTLVIHGRKANKEMFRRCNELSKCPQVLFHSFMGSINEAESFIKKGVNAYFSFGKQVLNGNKNVIKCVEELPLERLLCETDAPYQFLKGEKKTFIEEIERVYEAFSKLRKIERGNLCCKLEENFKKCFGIL